MGIVVQFLQMSKILLTFAFWPTGDSAYDICEPVYAARGYGKPGSIADPNFKEASFVYREAALSVFFYLFLN